MVFSSTFDKLNTNKIQVKCLSLDLKLRLTLVDFFMESLNLKWTRLSIHYTYITSLFSLYMYVEMQPQNKTIC